MFQRASEVYPTGTNREEMNDAVKAKAEERRLNTLKQNKTTEVETFPPRKSRDELGAMANVSGKTYEHAVGVIDPTTRSSISHTGAGNLMPLYSCNVEHGQGPSAPPYMYPHRSAQKRLFIV